MVGGEADEEWTCDLAGVGDRHGVVVLVPVFALGLGFASVLGWSSLHGKPLVGGDACGRRHTDGSG